MSAFNSSVTDGLTANLFHAFATAGRVRYKVAGATPVALSAVVGDEQKERVRIGGDTLIRRTIDIEIHTDPLSAWGGVAEPKTTDVLELDGRDYPIARVGRPLGDVVALTIELPSLHEHARQSRRDRVGR